MSRDNENWDEQTVDEDKENEGKDGKNNDDDDEGSVFSALLLAPFYNLSAMELNPLSTC